MCIELQMSSLSVRRSGERTFDFASNSGLDCAAAKH